MNPIKVFIFGLRLLPENLNPVNRFLERVSPLLAEPIGRLHPTERQALDRFLGAADGKEISPLFGVVRTLVSNGPSAVDKKPLYELLSSVHSLTFPFYLLVGSVVLPIVFLPEIERRIAVGHPANAKILAIGAAGCVSMVGIVLIAPALRRFIRWSREVSSPTALRILFSTLTALDLVRSKPSIGSDGSPSDERRRRLIARIEELRFLLVHQLPFHVSGPSRSTRHLACIHGWRAAEHLAEVAHAVALPSESTWAYVEEEIAWLFIVCADRNWGRLRLSPKIPDPVTNRFTLRSVATTLLVAIFPLAIAFGTAAITNYPLQDKAQTLSVLWLLFTIWRALDPNLRETLAAVSDGAKLFGYGSTKKD